MGFREDPVHFFASPEIISQYQNIRKWEGAEAVGLGVSTYQFMNNTQYHNHFDMDRYQKAVDSGRLPIWVGKKLDKDEQMARTMVLGMKRGRVPIKPFKDRFGSKPHEVYPETMDKLQDLGLIDIDDGGVKLTYKGTLFSEEVAIHFVTDSTRRAYERVGSKYAGYFLAGLPDY